jgi:hypothetical protein
MVEPEKWGKIFASQTFVHPLYRLLATCLELTVLEGFLQALRLQKSVYDDVDCVTFLATLGLVYSAWSISVDFKTS